jgi:phenylalanyl-tRNA synthetase beta chain
MRVSYNWLKEYVDIPVSPEELAEKMTMSGVAVENIEYPGKGLDKIVTGLIEKISAHPDADKLVICQINIGTETLQVVTGAPNVKEGQIIILALVGAVLPGGKITKAKLRGVESYGMLCSAQELGLDPKNFPVEQQEGVLVFGSETQLGMDVRDLLGLNDVILELELTPNRADCLSMVGVAREVAAVLGTQLKLPIIEAKETDENIDGKVTVDIKNPELCGRYVGRLIRNIKIGPSPVWMQQRLQAAGIRPISNIVDVTNYVLMELGQPLHAFDYDKLAGRAIIVRKAEAGEKMYSLDDVERELTSEMLIIGDAHKAVAIAGVMGGVDTEITDGTTSVLIESAYFNPPGIHRTSKKLALRSESSMRFEKGIDISGCLTAATRACQLIDEMRAGVTVKGAVDNFPAPKNNPVIKLRTDRVNLIVGTEIPVTQIKEIIVRLGFGVKNDGNDLLVEIPTRRGDIEVEIDLIEEVARLFGYNNIPTTLPEGASTEGRKTHSQVVTGEVIDVMTRCGLTEIVTISFMNPKVFDMLNMPQDDIQRQAVTVQNPLSEEQRVLRTTTIHGILDIMSRNVSRKNKDLAFFEVGRIFTTVEGEKLPKETLTLGAGVVGSTISGWQTKAKGMDFYYLKGVLETLFDNLNINNYTILADPTNSSLHPGRTARIELGGQNIGYIGEVHPSVAENYRLSERIYCLQVNLEEVIKAAGNIKKYSQLPKYPAVERDMAIVVSTDTESVEVNRIIKDNAGSLLESINLFDVYQGGQIKEGYKSMAFALRFQASDKTLTDEEVNTIHEKIQQALKDELQAELRA